MTDVFEIQDEISQAIVAKLKVQLAGDSADGTLPTGAIVKRYTRKPGSLRLYLRGRYELHKMTREVSTPASAFLKKRFGSIPATPRPRRSRSLLVLGRLPRFRRSQRSHAQSEGSRSPRHRTG